MNNTFLTTHTDWDAHQTLAFIVPAGTGPKVYIDPIWGIAVDAILADDREVKPQPFNGRLDDVDFRRMETRGEAFVLKMLMGDVKVAHRFESEEAYAITTYDVQMTSGLIEIRYRPRFGPGVMGPECRLVSTRV